MDGKELTERLFARKKTVPFLISAFCLIDLGVLFLLSLIFFVLPAGNGGGWGNIGVFYFATFFIIPVLLFIAGILTGKLARKYGSSKSELLLAIAIGSVFQGMLYHVLSRLVGAMPLWNPLVFLFELFPILIIAGLGSLLGFSLREEKFADLSSKIGDRKIRNLNIAVVIVVLLVGIPYVADTVWGAISLFNKDSAAAYCEVGNREIDQCRNDLVAHFAGSFKNWQECSSFVQKNFQDYALSGTDILTSEFDGSVPVYCVSNIAESRQDIGSCGSIIDGSFSDADLSSSDHPDNAANRYYLFMACFHGIASTETELHYDDKNGEYYSLSEKDCESFFADHTAYYPNGCVVNNSGITSLQNSGQ